MWFFVILNILLALMVMAHMWLNEKIHKQVEARRNKLFKDRSNKRK